MGRVGGDYEAYETRGKLALTNPEILILNEPVTVFFANLQNITGLPLPSFYFIFTAFIALYSIRKSQNRYIYIYVYTLFIIPVAIGYLRQGLSISFILLLISSNSKISKLLNAAAAVVAHPSAIFPVILFTVFSEKRKIIINFLIILIILLISFIYVGSAIEHYLKSYNLNTNFSSDGFIFRLIGYASCTIILFFGRSIEKEYDSRYSNMLKIQFLILFISLAIFFSNGSTAADRVLVYIIPFLIALYSINVNKKINILIILIGIIQFIGWLLLSPNVKANWNYISIFN
jgi:hypothetical protein